MSISIVTAFKTEVTFPFGKLNDMIDWCKKNCEGEWKFGDSAKGYTFYFENESDYINFLLIK